MADFNIPAAGDVCWRELRTKDLGPATEFYSKLFGWTLEQSKVAAGIDYKEIMHNGITTGGIMPMGDDWGELPSHWANYIAVNSVDETVAKITANGGAVHIPPFDAPGVGRMSMVADPSGASFAIIQFEQPQT